MKPEIKKIAMYRQREREELFPEVKEMIAKVEHDSGISLFPLTLRQVGLFLRYVRAAHREANRLTTDLQRLLTYYQGRRIIGVEQADATTKNWRTKAGREAAYILDRLGLS